VDNQWRHPHPYPVTFRAISGRGIAIDRVQGCTCDADEPTNEVGAWEGGRYALQEQILPPLTRAN
jgi:hypothetical protein